MARTHHQDPGDLPERRKPRTTHERPVAAELLDAFKAGAAGAPPTAAEGYWRTVGFITVDDDILDFDPVVEEETKQPTHLGELHHTPVRDNDRPIIPELLEAPIIDAVIVDDDEASQ